MMSDCINKEDSPKDQAEVESNNDKEVENDDVDFSEYQLVDEDDDNENAISLEKLKRQYADDEEPELKSGEYSFGNF